MLSILGCPSAYVKFLTHELATPFHCFHLPNTDNKSMKCSPKLQSGSTPSQHNCFKCFCDWKEHVTPFSQSQLQAFSALQEDDSPWQSGNVWSNLALYVFTLHIPFSFGGLSVVALFNGQPVLDPQTEALSLLTIQILDLSGALVLLKNTAKPQYKFSNFFKKNKLLSNRNWFLSSTLGFGFLVLLIFLTYIYLLTDYLAPSVGVILKLLQSTPQNQKQASKQKPVNNPILKEMLLNSDISRVSCVLAYCIVTPLLEEVVYRGFLLTSLSSTMEWQQSVAISSVLFSAIHFSGENFLQLFIIGCVLGCSYCWTGNLSPSIVIHSLYNALTLVITYFY